MIELQKLGVAHTEFEHFRWTAGYDGGEKLPIAFTTQFAEYYLMEASLEYSPIFHRIRQKIKLVKVVVEFLLDRCMDNPSYEDLAQHIESIGEYDSVEDVLIQNAQFVCDQVNRILFSIFLKID